MSTAIESSGGRRWYAQPDDLIGGWCVADVDRPPSTFTDPPPGAPPADGRYIAAFTEEESARRVAALHNTDLDRRRAHAQLEAPAVDELADEVADLARLAPVAATDADRAPASGQDVQDVQGRPCGCGGDRRCGRCSGSRPPAAAWLADVVVDLARLALAFGRIDRTAVYHPDGVTPESDTDHTVMLVWVACALAARCYPGLDVGLVAQFAAVHDAPEVYAGDTQTLRIDAAGRAAKAARERAASARLRREFGAALPWFPDTIARYEAQQQPEARFVRGVDKVLPKAVHLLDGAAGLREFGMDQAELRDVLDRQREDMRRYVGEFTELMALRAELADRVLNADTWTTDPSSAPTVTGPDDVRGGSATDMLTAQQRTWANKLGQGFNTTDVAFEFGLLMAELGEAFTAWRHGHDVGEELADVTIFTMGLAQMLGIDLGAEVQRKLEVNESRIYLRAPNGGLVKDGKAIKGPGCSPPDVAAVLAAPAAADTWQPAPTDDAGCSANRLRVAGAAEVSGG